MQVHVVAVGRVRDPAIDAACETYVTMARPLVPIVREAVRDVASAWRRVDKLGGPAIVLDERGEHVDSTGFAAWLSRWRDAGVRAVTALVGGADGFSEADRRRAERVMALSRLTLPHRLAQLVLCEQVYRAGTILAGHPYHRG